MNQICFITYFLICLSCLQEEWDRVLRYVGQDRRSSLQWQQHRVGHRLWKVLPSDNNEHHWPRYVLSWNLSHGCSIPEICHINMHQFNFYLYLHSAVIFPVLFWVVFCNPVFSLWWACCPNVLTNWMNYVYMFKNWAALLAFGSPFQVCTL